MDIWIYGYIITRMIFRRFGLRILIYFRSQLLQLQLIAQLHIQDEDLYIYSIYVGFYRIFI